MVLFITQSELLFRLNKLVEVTFCQPDSWSSYNLNIQTWLDIRSEMVDIKPIGKLTALALPENQSFAYLRKYALKTIKIASFKSVLYRIYCSNWISAFWFIVARNTLTMVGFEPAPFRTDDLDTFIYKSKVPRGSVFGLVLFIIVCQ